jgi:hypothetical protein
MGYKAKPRISAGVSLLKTQPSPFYFTFYFQLSAAVAF